MKGIYFRCHVYSVESTEDSHKISEVSLSKFSSALNAEEAKLKELRESIVESYPEFEISVDEDSVRAEIPSDSEKELLVEYDMRKSDKHVSCVYVLVYEGIRGKYVLGVPSKQTGAGLQHSSYDECSSEERFACELVEDYLDEEGVLDERYAL